LITDFEGSDYADWKTTGDAFGNSPTDRITSMKHFVSGVKGDGLAESFINGGRSIGTLTSLEFKVQRKYSALD